MQSEDPLRKTFGYFCLHLGWTVLSAITRNNKHVWGDTIMEGGRSCRDGEKVTNLGQRRAMIPCRFSALMRADMFTSGM